jgi:probable rRNA maturation factor
MKELLVRNEQRALSVDGRRLRLAARRLLEGLLGLQRYQLGVHLVSGRRMAALNQQWLGHQGPTDVITFDHRAETPELDLHGEIFLCPEMAVIQAREYGASREAEVLRYLVHGVLHLRGYDDRAPDLRRRMKRRENQLLRHLLREFEAGAPGGVVDFQLTKGEPCRQS